MTDNINLETLIHTLTGNEKLLDENLDLHLAGYTMRIRLFFTR
jgi:hypothetical protein